MSGSGCCVQPFSTRRCPSYRCSARRFNSSFVHATLFTACKWISPSTRIFAYLRGVTTGHPSTYVRAGAVSQHRQWMLNVAAVEEQLVRRNLAFFVPNCPLPTLPAALLAALRFDSPWRWRFACFLRACFLLSYISNQCLVYLYYLYPLKGNKNQWLESRVP